ncbi:MAG TPA: ADP-ribosyltransferase [Microbacterium sp.]|nr:ADP-ribosyltransferase [Microbacterium sp.]
MPSPIDPEQIPGKLLDPDTIEAEARTIGTIAGSVRDNGSDVHLKWQAMSGVYSAPESGALLGLMQPVSSQATAVGDNLETVSSALAHFAGEVRPIKAELDSLRVQAEAFGREIDGGVSVRELNPAWISTQSTYGTASTISYSSSSTGGTSTAPAEVPQYRNVTKEWHEAQEYVDRNNELISAVNAQQLALWEAERTCANKIRALYGAAALRGFQSEDDALGYGLDEIPEGTEMPWGAPVERTEGCGEATAKFVFKDFLWEGLAVGGVWGTVQGLGTLVLGYNPATGDWFSGDAYGAAWGNLGMLGVAALTNTGILAPIFHADSALQASGGGGFLPQEVRDFKADADEAALNTGKALIAWDKWEDDPGTALGESVFNVGTALIPVGGAAVAGVKTASTAASVLTKMTRVVEFIDPAAWAVNGTLKIGGAGLGSLDNLIGRVDGFETPTIEVYTAMDSPSALSTLDDWGVDLNTVAARVDDGIPVLEFPGGRIELPAGAFDGGVRIGDEGASVTAHVREPELVGAGGVRGETGSGAVNTIVDDAPVRTGGTDDPGTGGSAGAGDAGGGSGSGDEGAHPRGDAPENVPPHTGLSAPPAHAGADAPPLPADELAEINDEFRLPSGEVDPARFDEWTDAVSDAYPALTPDQVRGIYDYTTDPGYEAMNPYLRNSGATPADVTALEGRITDTTEGLANLPAEPSLGQPYSRGVRMFPEFLDQFQVGRRWSDPSFMSSSSSPGVAENFAAEALSEGKTPGIITIDGQTPSSITPLSRYQLEAEFLFQRGTQFDVVSKFQDSRGVWRIHLREVVE